MDSTIKHLTKQSQEIQSKKMKINFITYYDLRSSTILGFQTFGRRTEEVLDIKSESKAV